MASFDSHETRNYVGRCISLAEKLATEIEPTITPTDLIVAIQSELPIPITLSELPPTGILGMIVNLSTIVSNDAEDPIEYVEKTFFDRGIKASVFPGSCDRES